MGACKRNYTDIMKSCIKAQHGLRHHDACYSCNADCEVLRTADNDHWANKENRGKPIYNFSNCPKVENVEKLKIRKFRGKRR